MIASGCFADFATQADLAIQPFDSWTPDDYSPDDWPLDGWQMAAFMPSDAMGCGKGHSFWTTSWDKTAKRCPNAFDTALHSSLAWVGFVL